MKISKKKYNELNCQTIFMDILKENIGTGMLKYFNYENFNYPPETWSDDEKFIFDLLSSVESRIKEKIFKILTHEKI